MPKGTPAALLAALLLATSACGAPAGTASPTVPLVSAQPSPSSPSAEPATPSTPVAPSGSIGPPVRADLAEAAVPDVPFGAALMFLPLDGALVAIGFDGGSGSFVWESADDARTWTALEPPQAYVTGVAERDGRYVGVGGLPTLDLSPVVAISLSDDATDWEVVLLGQAINGGLNDIAADADGFIAVGQAYGQQPALPGAWVSPNGRDWTAGDTGSVPGVMIDVVRGGPGLVAAGAGGQMQSLATAWTSADGGLTWSIGSPLEGGEGMVADEVVRYGETLVLVAHPVGGGDARLWTSTDGLAWTPTAGLPSQGFIRSLVPTSHGLVAVGGDGILDARAWISADGTEWATLVELPNAYFETAVEVGPALVIGGASQFPISGTQSTRSFASIWIAELGR